MNKVITFCVPTIHVHSKNECKLRNEPRTIGIGQALTIKLENGFS